MPVRKVRSAVTQLPCVRKTDGQERLWKWGSGSILNTLVVKKLFFGKRSSGIRFLRLILNYDFNDRR